MIFTKDSIGNLTGMFREVMTNQLHNALPHDLLLKILWKVTQELKSYLGHRLPTRRQHRGGTSAGRRRVRRSRGVRVRRRRGASPGRRGRLLLPVEGGKMPPRPSTRALVARGKLLFDWAERANPDMLLSNNGAKGANRAASASVQDAGGRTITAPTFATALGGQLAGAGFAFASGARAAPLSASLRGERAAIAPLSVALARRRPGLARALPAWGTPGAGRISAARSLAAAGVRPLLGLRSVAITTGNVAEGILDIVGAHDGIRGFSEPSVELSLGPVLHLHQRFYRVGARGVNEEVRREAGLAKLTRRGQP
jgi:hypothetical protein